MLKKITLLYQTNIEGIYTKEEETATDDMVLFKEERMLDRWLKILCPHIDFTTFMEILPKQEVSSFKEDQDNRRYLKYKLILETLDSMNQQEKDNKVQRHLEIKVENI